MQIGLYASVLAIVQCTGNAKYKEQQQQMPFPFHITASEILWAGGFFTKTHISFDVVP